MYFRVARETPERREGTHHVYKRLRKVFTRSDRRLSGRGGGERQAARHPIVPARA